MDTRPAEERHVNIHTRQNRRTSLAKNLSMRYCASDYRCNVYLQTRFGFAKAIEKKEMFFERNGPPKLKKRTAPNTKQKYASIDLAVLIF